MYSWSLFSKKRWTSPRGARPKKGPWVSLIAFTVTLLLYAGMGHTTQIISSPTGLTSPVTILTFSEIVLPNHTPLTTQYDATFGITFTGLFYNGCPGVCVVAPPNGVKPDIGNFANENINVSNPSASITLDEVVDGIAFNFAGLNAPFTFQAFLGTTLVETITVSINANTCNSTNGWCNYGFENIQLDRIQITAGAAFIIDQLQIGAVVPEPSTYLLLTTGLLGLLGYRWRQRKPAA